MNVRVNVVLVDGQGDECCGPGLLQLLEEIRRLGSIRQAARKMDLSYVKALKILNRLDLI